MKFVRFSFLIVSVFLANSAIGQFFCPNGVRTIVNELDFEINIETNEIIFDLTCDPCSFEDGGSSCECKKNCNIEPTEEDLTEYGECTEECEEDYGDDPVYEDYCLDGCEYGLFWRERQCINACGASPRIRIIDRHAYAFNFWWTHGLTQSQQGAPDELFISNILDGFTSKITHNSTEDFENESISYCYQYEVYVEYDDGTCCRYVGAACFQKG